MRTTSRTPRRPRARKAGWTVHDPQYRTSIQKILPHAVLRGPRKQHLDPCFGLPNQGPDRYGTILPWRALTLSPWHGASFPALVEQCRARMTDGAATQLAHPPFPLRERETEDLLVRVTSADLGLPSPVPLARLLEQALEVGLLFCTKEHVLALLLSAITTPIDRPSMSICTRATVSGSRTHRYGLSHSSRIEGPYLTWAIESLSMKVWSGDSFVFLLPEAHHQTALRGGRQRSAIGKRT